MAEFSFIQITDHHLLESPDELREGFSPGYALRMVMRHIAQHTAGKADFIISTGDLVEPPTEKAYQCAIDLLGIEPEASLPGPLKINTEGLSHYPLYFLPGNHDDRDLLARCLFPSSTSPDLYNFTFVHKGIQFIFMDWGPESRAFFFPETREFLIQALQSDVSSVIVCHQHVKPIGSRWLDSFIAEDIGQFWEILTKQGIREKVLGILCGHVHITYEDEYKGIQILGLRSTAYPFEKTDEVTVILAPPHYRFITIKDNILTSRVYKVPV